MNLPTPEDLKKFRKNCGLTQQELAERASVSQSLIARIEAGSVDPRLSTIRRILKVLNDTVQKELKAINVAVTEVITVEETDSISKASKIIFNHGFSQVPVCDVDEHVIGAIKETTITSNLIKNGTGILSQPIKEIMTKDDALPMLPVTASLKAVEDLLIQHGDPAVLLINEGKIAGIITKADLIRNYLR